MGHVETLKTTLKQHGLREAAVTAVVNSAKPSLSLTTVREEDENRIPIGATRIGGSPDLPHGTAWPTAQGVNFRFIAQVNLREAAALLPASPLPKSGLLSFFWCQEDTLGMTPEGVRVMYTRDTVPLERVVDPWTLIPERVGMIRRALGKKPSERGLGFWPCRTSLSVKLTLPDSLAPEGVKREVLSDEESDEVDGGKLERTLDESGVLREGHRLLGAASPIQGPVEFDAAFDSPETPVMDPAISERAAAEWRLLLQIDSDFAPGFCFGDWGTVYFMIRKADLAAGRWERVRGVVQCH
jgi:hypothetical protein